jgi:two-component system, NtrC family, sensor histidine kinase HydH
MISGNLIYNQTMTTDSVASAPAPVILIVDDDKLITDVLNDLLTETGYRVRAARGGQEALDRLASPERAEIDLVLLDVMMPDLDGFTVLKRLRAAPRTEHLIVIMLTGRDAPTEKTHGLQLGADDYIAKPFDANELLARVNSMLRLHRAEQNLWARNQALAALNAVAQTMGRAVELPDVLNSALDQVLASLDLRAGFITLRAPGGRQVIAAQRWPISEAAHELLMAEQVAQTGQAQLYLRMPPTQTDRSDPALEYDAACVPLISRNRILGTLSVVGLPPSARDALNLLMSIGSQIGAAVERAKLYYDAQQHSEDLAVLNEITRAVTSSLELDRVLTMSLHSIRQILHVQAGSLILVDAESGERQFRNTLAEAERWLRADATADGLLDRLVTTREPLIWNDPPPEARSNGDAGESWPVRNVLAVPLIVKSRVLGAIVVLNREEGAFTSDNLEMLQFLAAAIGVAIENARLYGELADFARELERSQAQLIQSEKLAATGRLAASIAHEINNPLQAIHNCLYLALNRPLTADKKLYYLAMAQEETGRLITLVQRTLEFYRPSKGQAAATDVNHLIENVLALSNKRLEHGRIQVHAQLQPDLPPILGVPDQLTQVLLNLVINAIEAMPEGGELNLSTTLDAGWLRIEVRDTGPGISPDEAARIFEPFYTTKANGTGLGLAVSYGIIQRYGGRIEVAGASDCGTIFTIVLPIERQTMDE